MPRPGDLVKPIRPPFIWRLGVVESVLPDGRCWVRSYIAPPHAYEGSASAFESDEIAVVPLDSALAYLIRVRAEVVHLRQVERQLGDALRAVEGREGPCPSCGVATGHEERCLLATALR